ncbi:tetratricopeptide repeat protein [Streptomyces sp. NPDC008238]
MLGRHEEAVAFLERSLALADERFAVAVHINLGDAHRCAGAPDAAGPHYRQALRLAEEHAPDLLSFCCRHPGRHGLEQGRTEEAREWPAKALRLVDRAGRPVRRRSAPGGAAGPSAG